MIVKASIFR